MQFLTKLICVFILTFSSSSRSSFTDELTKAQNELNVSFEFVELYLQQQMELWLGNMTELNGQNFLPDFFNSRSNVLVIINETKEYIKSAEESACKDNVHWKWNRQAKIVGNRLQNCMRIIHRIAEQEFDDM